MRLKCSQKCVQNFLIIWLIGNLPEKRKWNHQRKGFFRRNFIRHVSLWQVNLKPCWPSEHTTFSFFLEEFIQKPTRRIPLFLGSKRTSAPLALSFHCFPSIHYNVGPHSVVRKPTRELGIAFRSRAEKFPSNSWQLFSVFSSSSAPPATESISFPPPHVPLARKSPVIPFGTSLSSPNIFSWIFSLFRRADVGFPIACRRVISDIDTCGAVRCRMCLPISEVSDATFLLL